jgi:hypothetical protein
MAHSSHRALLLVFAAGCGSPAPPDNVIDAVLAPMLAAQHLDVVPEDPAVLCRRLAIDLTGVAPTPDVIAASCVGRSPRDMAVQLMNAPTDARIPDGSPPYVWVNRRWWADRFQYQSTQNDGSTWYTYVRDLDDLVGQLYAGTLPYDAFTRRALASPAFARRFGDLYIKLDLVEMATRAYQIFLGRDALPSEAADFGNLWRSWAVVFMNDAASRAIYPDCPTSGCDHYDVGVDGSHCDGAKLLGCQSTVMGAAAVVPSQAKFVRWYDLLPEDLLLLETPGRLIVAQREFAEAAVDRALEQYLGWWKTSTYLPDTDVPAVRDALVQKLIASGYDLRALDLEIVSSLLYTQRAAIRPDAPTAPVWASGPTKMFYAEAWLDTLAAATGRQLGGCDFRFSDTTVAARTDSIQIKYRFPTSPGFDPLFYSDTAHGMGGCPTANAHGSPSGLAPAVTRRVALQQICAGAFAPASPDELLALAYQGLGRPATDEETAIWMQHLTNPAEGGCDPQRDGACDLQGLADQLCASLYTTAQLNYY